MWSASDISTGQYTILAVSDNGRGISPDIIDKIFDPFFTTKEISAGSGLGLSMVQGFMRQSGGSLRVNSEIGRGTTIELMLPARSDAAISNETAFARPTKASAGARILLIEDQDEVRRIMKKSLEVAGFEMICVSSGDEALAVFTDENPFDLVITDVVMPGQLQGPEVARLIKSKKPNQRIIFISGYTSESDGSWIALENEVKLRKPVKRDELIRVSEGMLSGEI